MNEFKTAFPSLFTFIQQSKDKAKKDGYIMTLFGRRRYLPEINSDDFKKRASDERKAVNSRIQGSASDLVKLTMLQLVDAIRKQNLDAVILLQIHDELIFEVKNDTNSVEQFIKLICKEMTMIGKILKTKLSIKVKKGLNWSELEEVNIDY